MNEPRTFTNGDARRIVILAASTVALALSPALARADTLAERLDPIEHANSGTFAPLIAAPTTPAGAAEPIEIDLASLAAIPTEAREGERVSFMLRASDLADVDSVSLYLEHVESHHLEVVSLRAYDGLWFGTMEVSATTPAGAWRPRCIFCHGRDANETYLYDARAYSQMPNHADLSALDFVVVPSGCSLVTYRDGCEGALFDDVHLLAVQGQPTPSFDGVPKRKGYRFGGWSPELTATVTDDEVHTAVWKKKGRSTAAVTYTDGCGGLAFEDVTYYVRRGDATPAAGFTPERRGYTFEGWDEKPAPSVKGDVTYTARWDYDATYVVALDEGPVQVSVNNPSLTSIYGMAAWYTSDLSIGRTQGYTLSIGENGVTLDSTFYPVREGYAVLSASDSVGTDIGSCSVLVTPAKPSIVDLEITLGDGTTSAFPYEPGGVRPSVTVRDGDTTLVEGEDYTLEYLVEDGPGMDMVEVRGMGGYGGKLTRAYLVEEADLAAIASIDEIAAQEFVGLPVTPDVVVRAGDRVLEEGADYELAFSDNDHLGTARVTVTGQGSYQGSISTEFTLFSLGRDGWVDLGDGVKGYVRGSSLVTGWLDLDDAKYWFDEAGRMATGWTDVEVGGVVMHYYFNPASGNMARGTWMEIEGKKYYFRPSGNMATGFADVGDGSKRFFDESGAMLTGWHEIDGKTYYFRASGAMQTGEATIDGAVYAFGENGVLTGAVTPEHAGGAELEEVTDGVFPHEGEAVRTGDPDTKDDARDEQTQGAAAERDQEGIEPADDESAGIVSAD